VNSSLLRNPFLIFALKRASVMALTFFIVLFLIFLLPRMIPGNPLWVIIGNLMQQAVTDPEQLKGVEKMLLESFGFHKPLYIQFIEFLGNVFKGDLGMSVLFYPTRVTTLIATYLPWTIALVTPAVALAWFVGNNIGVMAAMNRNRFIDKVLLTVLVVLQGTPSYIFGMYLIMLLAVYLPVFPTGGSYPPGMVPRLSPDFILAYLRHYILPFIAIFLTSLGGWGLSMRSIAVQELSSDYMDYLRVIGVSQRRVSRYLFKCSALPQIVGLAIVLGWSVAGSVITEIVFSYQGIGLILWRGVQSLDYPLIQGIFIIIIGTLLLANYISELLFAYIDPRIRYAYVGR